MAEVDLAQAKAQATQQLEEQKMRAAAMGKLRALVESEEWQYFSALAQDWINNQRKHLMDQTRTADKTRAHMTDDWLRGTIGGGTAVLRLPILEIKAFEEEQKVAAQEAAGGRDEVARRREQQESKEQMGLRASPLPERKPVKE